MKFSRREFLTDGASAAVTWAAATLAPHNQGTQASVVLQNKKLGTIVNNDINNILNASSGKNCTPEEYQRAVYAILDMKPGVLAQNVGMPDAVLYPSSVATTFDRHIEEVMRFLNPKIEGTPETARRQADALRNLFAAGTDPLTLTIQACRERGVTVLADYRMNAEDFYQGQTLLSDFEKQHPEWKIPGANCLDPAVPQVYEHRMKIFTEVAERYDIDGIEFDFRRWSRMVSDPLKNHGVLTRMVRETRRMLDETARKKGRKKFILGARVGPSVATAPSPFHYPGCMFYLENPSNASCQDLGLDVKAWVAEGIVDYLSPALFGPHGRPRTREFAELTKGTSVGLYPTLWSITGWQHGIFAMDRTLPRPITLEQKDQEVLALYKDDMCALALKLYEDGADGISTFNWQGHLQNAKMPGAIPEGVSMAPGSGDCAVQTYLCTILNEPAAIRHFREQPWAVPPKS